MFVLMLWAFIVFGLPFIGSIFAAIGMFIYSIIGTLIGLFFNFIFKNDKNYTMLGIVIASLVAIVWFIIYIKN